MSRIIRRTSQTLLALFVIAALAFGAVQVLAVGETNDCPQPSPGTCPPYNETTCNETCLQLGYEGGMCTANCCLCLAR